MWYNLKQVVVLRKNRGRFTNLMRLEYFQGHYPFNILYFFDILSANPSLHLKYSPRGGREIFWAGT